MRVSTPTCFCTMYLTWSEFSQTATGVLQTISSPISIPNILVLYFMFVKKSGAENPPRFGDKQNQEIEIERGCISAR